MARIFLGIVGIAYIALAAWCAILPEKTAKAIGFTLQSGGGQSEYFTVYGGLQLALGILFLWPVYRPSDTPLVLLFCLTLHAALVFFRSASFVLYAGIPSMTYILAVVEWIIFLGAAFVYWRTRA